MNTCNGRKEGTINYCRLRLIISACVISLGQSLQHFASNAIYHCQGRRRSVLNTELKTIPAATLLKTSITEKSISAE